MKQIMKRVDMQVAILLSIFVAVVSMTGFIAAYQVTYRDMIFTLNSRVETIYHYLEEKLDLSTFSDIDTRDDIEKEEYEEMHRIFSAVKEISSVMYLYTAKKTQDGSYIYVIDGLDVESEDFRYPGDPIEEEIYDDMDRALDGEEIYPDNILHTSWGDIFICYLPLTDHGNIVGVLGIEFEAGHQYITYQRLKFFVPVLILIFTLLSFWVSGRLFERISNPAFKDMSCTDFVTGLKNRNAYQLCISNMEAMKRLNGTGIVVLDLNGLKKINDKYGHEAGDRYICMMAQAYEQAKVDGDKGVLYRVGGDEFIILIENSTKAKLEQLVQAISKRFDLLRQDEKMFSFSYGVSIFDPMYDETLSDTYHRADNAMYLFKRRFYDENPQYQQFDLHHHMIQQSVINALSYSYVSYQVFDWETECLIDYGVCNEQLRGMIEQNLEERTYSESIREYLTPMLFDEDKEKIFDTLSIVQIRKELTKNREYHVQGRISYLGEDCYVQLCFIRMQEIETGKSFIVAYRNVTEQVIKEEKQKQILRDALYNAEVASKAKTNFLFNMSHDIRTPMNAIIGFTQIAKEHITDTQRVGDCLSKVEHASGHLLRLINDILDMARIESGKMEIRPDINSIRAGVMETKEVFQEEMEEKRIHFQVVLQDVENDLVFCDSLRVRQITWNLLSNAVKYTKPGGSVLYQVKQTGKDEQGFGFYELLVKDNGMGMSKEFQERLFDIFERERSSTESGVEGTGLGLAITKKLVDLLGGTIDVYSKEGVGSEFLVRLKLETASGEMSPLKIRTDPALEQVALSGKRVLLAEDNELNREIAEIILSEQGFLVETAEDGVEAVQMISKSKPGYYDLILMDIQMPRMNGYEAAEKVRKLKNPKLAGIPIVAMTANAFEEDKRKVKEFGMNAHVAKPIDIDTLMETLRRLFV